MFMEKISGSNESKKGSANCYHNLLCRLARDVGPAILQYKSLHPSLKMHTHCLDYFFLLLLMFLPLFIFSLKKSGNISVYVSVMVAVTLC